MSEDELELDKIGDRKTALFVIISDTDDTFNFVVSIMYSKLFNLLCDKADDVYGGRLPVHVSFLLDEFANIGLIPKFEKLIATIRSREISASIILQEQSQLKEIYKENADTIVDNCDSTLFLGEKLKIQYNKKVMVVYGIVTILTIIFITVTLFWGSIDIHFQDNNFTIEAQGWSDYTVAYTQIDSISYEENLLQNSNDYRTNGLGNFKYAMGNFRNDVYGNYIRYTHSSCHSYVVMSVDGKILVINGENDSATEEIYHTISEKMSRELE